VQARRSGSISIEGWNDCRRVSGPTAKRTSVIAHRTAHVTLTSEARLAHATVTVSDPLRLCDATNATVKARATSVKGTPHSNGCAASAAPSALLDAARTRARRPSTRVSVATRMLRHTARSSSNGALTSATFVGGTTPSDRVRCEQRRAEEDPPCTLKRLEKEVRHLLSEAAVAVEQ